METLRFTISDEYTSKISHFMVISGNSIEKHIPTIIIHKFVPESELDVVVMVEEPATLTEIFRIELGNNGLSCHTKYGRVWI